MTDTDTDSTSVSYAVVIPTLGRPSLDACLNALAQGKGPAARRIVLVDDRPRTAEDSEKPDSGDSGEPLRIPDELADRTVVLRSGGRGPAAARNMGWRAAEQEWIAFLDDDTVPGFAWARALAADLARAGSDVAGVQGRISVPLPADRRPTDWERGTATLADSSWITADMAFRRVALEQVGGFDERFGRAYREDADLALRLLDAGWRLELGLRGTVHPVRPGRFWASVRSQAGNADDVLMRRLHGPDWRERCGAPRGRLRRHLVITGAAAGAAVCAAARAKRPAAALAAGWLAGVAEFTWTRVRPGPRDGTELARMAVTSPIIPVAATAHWLRGLIAHRNVGEWMVRPEPQDRFNGRLPVTSRSMNGTELETLYRTPMPTENGVDGPWVVVRTPTGHQPGTADLSDVETPAAVLFDRDGTLVEDVPYNGDPAAVRLRPGAAEAVDALRAHGIAVGVVTNQSGIAHGFIDPRQVEAVHRRIEELTGPFDVWAICPHSPDDECGCRKPAPGLVSAAAEALSVPVSAIVVVGDIGSDVQAAEAAGATGILVPTDATRPEEIAAAARSARSLMAAARSLLPEPGAGEVR